MLLGRIAYIKARDGVRKITQSDREAIEACNSEFSRNGLRVLAFAYKAAKNGTTPGVDDENDLVFLGLISMMDPPREESKAAVAECVEALFREVNFGI